MLRALVFAGALLFVLVTGTGATAAGRVVLKKDAALRCNKDQMATHRPAGLKAVDWCNRDYGGKGVSLRGGRDELHEYADMGGPHDTRLSDLQDVAYLDVDGDGAAEALVVLHRVDWFVRDDGTSSSREFSSIIVHRWTDGKPAYLGSVDIQAAPVFAIAAWKGKLAVRSGKTPKEAGALQRFQLTPDGFQAR